SLASLYGIAQFLGYDPFPWGEGSWLLLEAPATFGNPNVASHVLAPALILACALATRRRGRWALVCVALFLGHFALTQTRGSLLALLSAFVLVCVALLVFRLTRRPARTIALAFGTLLVAGLIVLVAVGAVLQSRTGHPFPSENSLTLRAHSFYEACRMIQDKPLLGYGPGMYEVASPPYWTPLNQDHFITENKMNYQVHNEPLQFAVEAGLPAGIAYVAILVLGMYYGLLIAFTSDDAEKRPLGLGLAGFFLAFLVDGFFGFNAHVPVSSLLLFLLAGATVGVWRGPRAEAEEQPVRRGWGVFARRLAVLACAALIPVFGIREFASQFWQNRGLGAMEHKVNQAALESFRVAAALSPHHWLPPYYMGMAAAGMGDYQNAGKYHARALALNPNYIPAQLNFGKALLSQAAAASATQEPPEIGQAVEWAQRAARILPRSPEVYDLLGRAALLRAQRLAAQPQGNEAAVANETWRTVEGELLKAVDLGSKHKDQLYRLVAVARFARGDTPGGHKALVLSLREKPDDTETWQLFLQSSQRAGHYDDLRSTLDWALEQLTDAQNAEIGDTLHILRGNVLYAGYGDAAGAEAEYRVVVDVHPENAEAWAAYHALGKATGQQEGFRNSLAQAVAKLDPASPELSSPLRAALLSQGQGEDAVIASVSTLMDALQQHQATPGSAATAAEQFSWALDLLTERVKRESLSPEDAGQIYFRLGLAYGACRDFNTAAELLEVAAQNLAGSQLQECLLRRGAALVQAGNTAAAVQAYEKAVANDAANIDARYALAQALVQDGQRDRARQEFEAILSTFEVTPEGRQAIQQALEALGQ
ncbi:MAG: O-antigen ligase family protein, partial [FCB group bacterium]|nr:O-antigen ligase family protein [FCB group bacterium]